MKSDSELRHDVERELEWEPSLDERRIGVSVVDGIVTLTGEVSTYAERWNAERAVERVRDVRGIANELTVKSSFERTDTDIAKAAADALKWNVMVPSDRVTVKVRNGWVTLTGDVNWDFQRRAAERAVRQLPGVVGISNLITIKPRVEPKDLKHRIEETFKREAAMPSTSASRWRAARSPFAAASSPGSSGERRRRPPGPPPGSPRCTTTSPSRHPSRSDVALGRTGAAPCLPAR
jgi:osmotically-inducible protein OsmY